MPADISLSLELGSEPEAASRARHAVDDRFSRVLPPRVLADAMTVVSELINNAVQHGPGGPVKVHLNASRLMLRGEVEDDGNGVVAMREIDGMAGGYGLHIVDALVDGWGVYPASNSPGRRSGDG